MYEIAPVYPNQSEVVESEDNNSNTESDDNDNCEKNSLENLVDNYFSNIVGLLSNYILHFWVQG